MTNLLGEWLGHTGVQLMHVLLLQFLLPLLLHYLPFVMKEQLLLLLHQLQHQP